MVGFTATAAENAKHLPEKAIEIPMLVVSTALQLSLRAQQQYATYAARGEQILTGHGQSEEVAGWATFDPPVDDLPEPAKKISARRGTAPSRFDAVDEQQGRVPLDSDFTEDTGDEGDDLDDALSDDAVTDLVEPAGYADEDPMRPTGD